MPTELVAAPVSTLAVPQGMGINPVFDWTPLPAAFGLPLWFYITIFVLFIEAAIVVYWMARIRKLSAVMGWYESKQKMNPNDVQVWLLTRTLSLFIYCLKIEDNILSYHDKTKVGMWHHNTKESVINIGGQPGVVIGDDWDQTRDFLTEIALTDTCDEFNSNQEQLQTEYDYQLKSAKQYGQQVNEEEFKAVSPINNYTDYEAFGREILGDLYPNGLKIKSYNIFNNLRFLKYTPKACSPMQLGAELILEARDLPLSDNPKGFWEKYGLQIGLLVVGGLVFLGACFVPLT